jgi:hypothetical protein
MPGRTTIPNNYVKWDKLDKEKMLDIIANLQVATSHLDMRVTSKNSPQIILEELYRVIEETWIIAGESIIDELSSSATETTLTASI